MKPLLPLLLLLASPAYADAMPDGSTPDIGRTAAPRGPVGWRPDGTRITRPFAVGQAQPGAPIRGGGPVLVDGAGRHYTSADLGGSSGFIPIPVGGTLPMRQYGGGIATVYGLPSSNPNIPPEGPDGPEKPGTPGGGGNPPDGTPVPGPLPLLGAAAAFGLSRKLRRRLKKKPTTHHLYGHE